MMEYPSTKRMKKRKELDALVADKKKTLLKSSSPGSSLPDRLLKSSLIKPMMIKTRGDHQLLRSQDSDSEDEFVSFNKNDISSSTVTTSQLSGLPNAHNNKQQLHQQPKDGNCPKQCGVYDDDDDDVTYALRGDGDLESSVRRHRIGCCGGSSPSFSSSSSSSQKPYLCCSRCCHFALLTLCILGLATLAWMHLGLKREVSEKRAMESRLLRLSIGYTKLPPKVDELRRKFEEASNAWRRNFEVDEKKLLLPVNRTVEGLKSRVETLQRSVDELTSRWEKRKESTRGLIEAKEGVLELKSETIGLRSNFGGLEKDLRKVKEEIGRDEKRIQQLEKKTTTKTRRDEELERRLTGLEAALREVKGRVEDWIKEEEDGGEDESRETSSARVEKEKDGRVSEGGDEMPSARTVRIRRMALREGGSTA